MRYYYCVIVIVGNGFVNIFAERASVTTIYEVGVGGSAKLLQLVIIYTYYIKMNNNERIKKATGA